MSHNVVLHLIIIHFQNPELSSRTNKFGDYAGNIISIFICLLLLLLLPLCAFLFHPHFFVISQHLYLSSLASLDLEARKHLWEVDCKRRGELRSGGRGLVFWLSAEERSTDRVIMKKHCGLQNTADRQLWKMMAHLTRGSVCVSPCKCLSLSSLISKS